MARRARDWVDQIRVRAWTYTVREAVQQVMGGDALPGTQALADFWASYWLSGASAYELNPGVWSRWISGAREPRTSVRQDITRVLARDVGDDVGHRLRQIWDTGPDGAPWWASLRADRDMIRRAWGEHIPALRSSSAIAERGVAELIDDYLTGISQGSIELTPSCNHGLRVGDVLDAPAWTPAWWLAAQCAIIRLGWRDLVCDRRRAFQLSTELDEDGEPLIPDMSRYGVELDDIIAGLRTELTADRERLAEREAYLANAAW